MGTIYLLRAGSTRRSTIRGKIGGLRPTKWIYLGRNDLRRIEWESFLGEGFESINYGEKFQSLALQWRRPFLDWIGKKSAEFDSLSWWSSLIAEKNTLRYSLYHDICYLGIASDLAKQHDSLLVVCESPVLLRAIASHLGSDYKVICLSRNYPALESLAWLGKLTAKWGWYWYDAIVSLIDARVSGRRGVPSVSRRPLVLVHTCIDEDFFKKGEDRYFTVLPKHLDEEGCQVVSLPWLYNIRRSRREAFRWFRRFPNKYLIPEDFYSLSDYFWAMRQVLRQFHFMKGEQIFEGMNVSSLVAEHRKVQTATIGPAKFLRYYRLVKRLKEKGFEPDIFLDTFENNLTEKPQIVAFRKYMPKTLTIGYQHWASPAPLLLCSFVSEEEAKFAPLPDEIICFSPFSKEMFSREGYATRKLRVGPSLRYLHLFSKEESKDDERTVLVIFSLETNGASDVFKKLMEAFGSEDMGIRFLLKAHPMMTEKEWKHVTRGRVLPPFMRRVDGMIGDWLPSSTCAIIGHSSASMEFVLSGKPIVRLGRESDFDIDSVHWFPEFGAPVYDAVNLRKSVLRILSFSQAQRQWVVKRANQLREECVSPINRQTISAFIAGYRERNSLC